MPSNTSDKATNGSGREHTSAFNSPIAPAQMLVTASKDIKSDAHSLADAEISAPKTEHEGGDPPKMSVTDIPFNGEPPALSIEDENEDPYASMDSNTLIVIPITNPSAFPVQRIQEVQSQHYPSTSIADVFCHKTRSGPITQVTVDVQDGSVNHLFIRDPRLISALGLAPPDFDTIHLDISKLRLNETFQIKTFAGQRTNNLDEWTVGELVSARHAYLYWLDERRTASPKHGPYAAEGKAIAKTTGRRWPDVMQEILEVWRLEQGSDGLHYRQNRIRFLGEDPAYPERAETERVVRSMFA